MQVTAKQHRELKEKISELVALMCVCAEQDAGEKRMWDKTMGVMLDMLDVIDRIAPKKSVVVK